MTLMTPQIKLDLIKACPFTLMDAAAMLDIRPRELVNDAKRAQCITFQLIVAQEWAKEVVYAVFDK